MTDDTFTASELPEEDDQDTTANGQAEVGAPEALHVEPDRVPLMTPATSIATFDIYKIDRIEAGLAFVHCALSGPAGISTRYDVITRPLTMRDIIGVYQLPRLGVVVLPSGWRRDSPSFDFDLALGSMKLLTRTEIDEVSVLDAFVIQAVLQGDMDTFRPDHPVEFIERDGRRIENAAVIKRLLHIWQGIEQVLQVNYQTIEHISDELHHLTSSADWDRRSRDRILRLALLDDDVRDLNGLTWHREETARPTGLAG